MKVSYLNGVQLFDNSLFKDSRGSFQRIYDQNETSKITEKVFIQSSLSRNTTEGTLRGLHFQRFPSKEWKLITCIRGRLLDVLVDIRQNSETYGQHIQTELAEDRPTSLLVPPGIAHGFQTLCDDTWVLYQMTDIYEPGLAGRLHFRDSNLDISWPRKVTVVSKEDEDASAWPVRY